MTSPVEELENTLKNHNVAIETLIRNWKDADAIFKFEVGDVIRKLKNSTISDNRVTEVADLNFDDLSDVKDKFGEERFIGLKLSVGNLASELLTVLTNRKNIPNFDGDMFRVVAKTITTETIREFASSGEQFPPNLGKWTMSLSKKVTDKANREIAKLWAGN